ncbi:MAG: MEDS domain-containing protein [Archangiaceae bacterium]|nr:MEDS domain-containing protein [Archangiaceae bacterium]
MTAHADSQPILPAIAHMHAGDHYCGIYKSDEDHRRLVIDFVRRGVELEEKMFYIVNLQTVAQLKDTLSKAGIAVDALVAKGQLVTLTAKEAYLREGQFDPAKMIALLREETDKAIAEGYPALRCTGEMTWALGGEPGCERLVEYESMLNQFFPDSRCYAVCQYDRRKFDSEMLLDILHTHPKVLVGQEGYDNSKMYFVSPDLFLERDRQSALLDTWVTNLGHHGPTVA